MISRHWIGTVDRLNEHAYLEHLEKTVLPHLNSQPGLSSVYHLKREVPSGVEFLIVTEWESLDAIKKFAGENCETAVVDSVAQSLLLSYEKKVRHYTI
jgi:heme-degrading monooxygenase HmoA